MFQDKSFHQFTENSVVYRHLRDYFNNPVKRKLIFKGVIYAVVIPSGYISSHALTFLDMKLYCLYSLLLRKLRLVYDDDMTCSISSIDSEFARLVCEVAPHFGWRL